jgi:hypothetical protein
VQELFDELWSGCVACCLQGNPGGYDEWQKHRTMQCEAHAGTTGTDLDCFWQGIREGERGKNKGMHNCWWCWVSQKYCATGESMENWCQWPNVVVPLARTAAMSEAGEKII